MKISADIQDAAAAAAERPGMSTEEIQAGLRDKAEEFRESGGEIYVPETMEN